MAMNQIEFIGLKSEDNPTLKAFQLGTIASKEAKAKVGSKEIDLRFTSVPLKDNQGNVVAAFEMFVDETEIKQAMRRNEKLTLYQEKQTEKIVQALEQLSSGNIDFEIHLDEPDEDTKDAYDRFMQIVNALNITSNTIAALSGDANMLANAALEGRLDVRADASKHKGAYRKIIEGMNGALDNLIKPLNVAAEYVDRIAKGDIPPKITDEYKGDFNEIKNNLNQLIDNVNNLYQELGVLINAIGVGNLSVRGDLSKFRGVWNEIINSVNEIMLQVETPIQEVLEVLKRIAVNDFKNKITKNFQGIWDELKKNTNLTIERFDSTVEAVKKISLGNLEQLPEIKAIGKRCAADEMVTAFIKLMEALEAMAEDVRMLTESAIEGNLSVRADASKHYGIYKEIVNGFNETLDAVIAPVEEAGEVLNTMATGDLTVKVKGNYKGDHKKLQESINTLVDSFNDLIGRLLNSVETTASAAIQISSTADTMATSAQEQSAQTEEVASAIEQMARTVTENANNAQQTANVARQNREIAKEGGEIVELTVSKMSDIARVVKESADNIEKLGESSKQIGEIISVIDDIADQTNLLALNAAIEAARAGEQGRGFAVVADEVRKLAERTTEATKQIAEMIKGIQRDTEIAVRMMQNGNTEVTNGIQLADKAGAALKEIVDSSQHLLDMISQIATANEEQAATGEQITKNVAMISEVAQDSSRRVTEIAHSAEDLSRLTDELRELVSQFKIIQHEYEMSSQRTLTGKSNKYLSGRN
ncbi:MAG TPA: methyl-accepting chemotaxis protein [Candidatus Kapabacteria bacterium]|nr:methyl-accepting chemotaxis protein [Candidatus Kapabacteria bacterium]